MPYKDYEKGLAHNREYNRRYYHEHEDRRRYLVQKALKRKKEIRDWFKSYKKTLSCSVCGENHPACLDFHHKDNDGRSNWLSLAASRGWSKKRILKEIDKCSVLCANCHRKLHSDVAEGQGSSR